jgi:hypothetical protein
MSEANVVVDTFDGSIIVTLDYSTMSATELRTYVSLGYPEAIDEYFRRDSRADQKLDPYAPVQLPEP